ncbi:MAG: DUF4381 family protein [Verrucomicrobiota bacterium]
MNQSYTNIIDDLRLLEAPGWLPVWAWVLLIVAIALLVYYVIWGRKRRHLASARSPAESQAAGENALEALKKIHERIANEPSRTYAIEVSGVVRRYIERRFGIRAPRRSTEEFLMEARQSPLLVEKYQQKLGHFLGCCDFLKFAKGTAGVDELELLHQAAVIFVTETWLPLPEQPASVQNAPAGRNHK